jgi:hypothetical protein
MSEQLELTAVSLLARGRFVISLAITIESVSIEAYTWLWPILGCSMSSKYLHYE